MKMDIKTVLIGIVVIAVLIYGYFGISLSDTNIDFIKFLLSN